jgi:hypothetical protein
VAIAIEREADVLRIRGRLGDALAGAAAAEVQIAAVRGKDPNRSAWERDEALIRTVYARILLAARRYDTAATKAAAAAATFMRVDQKTPVKLFAATAYIVLGDSESARGHRAAAEQAWAAAEELLRPHVSRPDPKIGAAYAQALVRRGKNADAVPVIETVHRTGYRQFDFERACVGR